MITLKTWTDFKAVVDSRHLHLQYEELLAEPPRYMMWAHDGNDEYQCRVNKGTEDATDFENNYKAEANKPIIERNGDGREMVVSTSRPAICTTYFTCAGDDTVNGVIGAGEEFFFDFSNTDHDVTEDVPSGYKRKQIDFQFIDSTWIKEGTIYFHKALKRSYVDLFVVCPAGGYYYKNDGTLTQATEETVIQHFVNKLFVQGDCPMGDELNTESASEEIPSYMFYRMHITVPSTDEQSNGYINLEIFRERTVVLE